jgi:uncharacterized protein
MVDNSIKKLVEWFRKFMVEDTKINTKSAEDTISSIENAASNNAVDDIMELTETEMVSTSDNSHEELIDVKSFDESGQIKQVDAESELMAKAQNGDEDAIAAFSKSLKDEEETKSGQDDVDALLNNISQVAENSTEESEEKTSAEKDELSEKAEMLESASKNYASKDFAESKKDDSDNTDVDSEDDNSNEPPKSASMEDIAAAMSSVAPELAAKAKLADALVNTVNQKISLKAVPGINGLQVGFPIEVLAEALRPMVSDWVEANLPTIVEKLVKEELSKLADK